MTAMTRMKKWWLWAVAGAMGVSVVVDLGLGRDAGETHGGFSWVSLPGGDLLYGFIGCVVIVSRGESTRRVLAPTRRALLPRRGAMSGLHPALMLFAAALLVGLTRGRLRQLVLVAGTLLALLSVYRLVPDASWSYELSSYQLQLLRRRSPEQALRAHLLPHRCHWNRVRAPCPARR